MMSASSRGPHPVAWDLNFGPEPVSFTLSVTCIAFPPPALSAQHGGSAVEATVTLHGSPDLLLGTAHFTWGSSVQAQLDGVSLSSVRQVLGEQIRFLGPL